MGDYKGRTGRVCPEIPGKAAAAIASGRFKDEIIPVPVKVKKQIVNFEVDEHPRNTSAEALKVSDQPSSPMAEESRRQRFRN